jgi:hypothetical protein
MFHVCVNCESVQIFQCRYNKKSLAASFIKMRGGVMGERSTANMAGDT